MPGDRIPEILDAAGRCFARYGYEKTTMDEIGALVGMNKVSLYYYFANKEALFKAMLKREADDYLAKMKRDVGGMRGCRKRIEAWIELSFKYGSQSAVMRQVSMDTLRNLSPLLGEFRDSSLASSREEIAALLREGIEGGELRSCDAARVAASIVGIIGAAKDAAVREFMARPDEAIDTARVVKDIRFTVDLILGGLSAAPAAAATGRTKKKEGGKA